VKVGDLVRYRSRTDWLGIIVREIPGTMKIKNVEWIHESGDVDRGSYAAKDLELVSESR
jgi:hypothetical protein